MFIDSLFNCILENEEELPVENQDESIVSTLEQMRISTCNVTLVDSVQSKMQEILSEFFTIEKLSMLLSKEFIILDKKNQHVFMVYKIYIQFTSDAENQCSTSKWNKHRSDPSTCYHDKTWSWKASEE